MRKDGVENGNNKNILVLAILILTLAVGTTGATFAYFALSASNTGTITGASAKVETQLEVEKILPTTGNPGTGVMVPQYSANTTKRTNALKNAIDGGCVDANNNIVCQVYKIEYRNKSTATLRTNATLTLESQMTNLKWYTLANASDIATLPASATYTYPASFTTEYGNAKTTTTLGTAEEVSANNYRYWYVVIWIEEQGEDQYSDDGDKTFDGTIEIQITDTTGTPLRGLTSTFTG